ncbi:BatD [hydrothermal vent metagenome]|uniref:BatD n=1 Tax=hydrothermal vent metagenome TaxID=652676 RepID=A0A1W1BQQ8_9ZZZZ
MKNITNKIVKIALLLQLTLVSIWGGSFVAKVNDTNIVAGDRVSLTLEAKGDDITLPKVGQVGDYPVESISTSMQSSLKMINGTTTRENIKRLNITFTPDKDMTIPPFEAQIDGVAMKSNPVDIKIVKSLAPTSHKGDMVTLDMRVNQDQVFVGQPIELTVYFSESNRANLMKVEFQKPNFKDFFAKEIGGEKSYRKDNYIVHELKYVLIPKYEGNFTISPASARVAQRSQRRDDFFGTFFDTPKWSRVVSNSLDIKVKPIPDGNELIGDFTIDATIDSESTKANKPVNLTVTIEGEGNLEDFDALNYEIDGVTIYSDDAKVQSHLVGDRLISTYKKKFAFIADRDFTIPAKSFKVFDFKSGKSKTLNIKSFDIKVTGGENITPTVVSSSTPATTKKVETPKSDDSSDEVTELSDKPTDSIPSIWMLIVSFLAGILVTLGAIKFLPQIDWRPQRGLTNHNEALKILYPHTNDDAEIEQMVRDLYAKKGGDKSITIDKSRLKEMVEKYK